MKIKTQVVYPALFILGLIGAFELGLRLNGIEPGVYTRQRFNPYDFDPLFGWITRKDFSFLRISPDYMHYNYYNAEGFPVTHENWKKPYSKETEKIAMIGNSYVESYYLSYEKSFPYIFEKAMNTEVLNLGVSGYTPAQYLLQARKYIPDYKVKKVIFFFNPFQDIVYLDDPFFPGGYNKPVFDKDLEDPINVPLSQGPAKKKNILDYSSTLTFMQPLLNKWFGYVNENFIYKKVDHRISHTKESQLRVLRYAKKIQEEWRGEDLVTVYMPARFEFMDPDHLLENRKNFFEGCEELKLKCFFPDFLIEERKDFNNWFFANDNHPNELGSKKIAEALIKEFQPKKHYLDIVTEKEAPFVKSLKDKGAQFLKTPDGKSFYVLYEPKKKNPKTIISLHGHGALSLVDFDKWVKLAEKFQMRLIALQWWFGTGLEDEDFYTPHEVYKELEIILKAKKAEKRSVMLHGVSRGSAISYALTAEDLKSKNNFFLFTVSNSGGFEEDLPFNKALSTTSLKGAPFVLYCGENDKNSRADCEAMTKTESALKKRGAKIIEFIKDPKGFHGTFIESESEKTKALMRL